MIEMRWLSHLPNGTLEGGVDRVNQLYWYITVVADGQTWIVRGGDVVLLRTDSKEVADAFLYGFGLAYSVIPEPMFSQLREDIKSELE